LAGGEKSLDRATRHVRAEVDHEMPEVVFLLRTYSAVRQKDTDIAPGEAAHRVVHVDPRVHPFT